MSASAILLHRMLIKTESRGWKTPPKCCGDPGRELTQTAPHGAMPLGWNSLQSQFVNAALPGNPDDPESPHYSPTDYQKDRHG